MYNSLFMKKQYELFVMCGATILAQISCEFLENTLWISRILSQIVGILYLYQKKIREKGQTGHIVYWTHLQVSTLSYYFGRKNARYYPIVAFEYIFLNYLVNSNCRMIRGDGPSYSYKKSLFIEFTYFTFFL